MFLLYIIYLKVVAGKEAACHHLMRVASHHLILSFSLWPTHRIDAVVAAQF